MYTRKNHLPRAAMNHPQSHALGHPEIDAQHDDILAKLAALETLSRCPTPDAEALSNAYCDVFCALIEHFIYEERILALMPPSRQTLLHIEDHASLSGRLRELIVQAESADPALSCKLLHDLLAQWLQTHLSGFDKQFAPE